MQIENVSTKLLEISAQGEKYSIKKRTAQRLVQFSKLHQIQASFGEVGKMLIWVNIVLVRVEKNMKKYRHGRTYVKNNQQGRPLWKANLHAPITHVSISSTSPLCM